MVQQAVQDRRGERLVADELTPLREALAGREHDRAALVAFADESEEVRRREMIERFVADLVDDEQPRAVLQLDAANRFHLKSSLWVLRCFSKHLAGQPLAERVKRHP